MQLMLPKDLMPRLLHRLGAQSEGKLVTIRMVSLHT